MSDDKLLKAFASAAEGLPTRARGDPGKRSMAGRLRGELERKESGRGEDEIE